MTDEYSVGGRPITREPYRGRYRVNRRTGERQVWNGTTYVPETAASLAPEAQALIERERNELDRDNLSVRLGEQFLNYNQNTPTGSIVRRIPGLSEVGLAMNPGLQQMENIQNRFVRSQIREGTSGAGNTGPEQQRIERSGPNIANAGPANRAIVLGVRIDRDLRAARLSALEQWVRDPQNRGPEGFEQWWVQNEPRIRADIQRRYEITNGPLNNQAEPAGIFRPFRGGRQRPNPPGSAIGSMAGRRARELQSPPQRPPGVPASAQWNPRTRTWRTP